MKEHYQSRVKEEFLRRFAAAKTEYEDATEEHKSNGEAKKPIPVAIRTETGMEFWLLESDEFRAQVALDAEEAYARETQAWQELKEVPKTAVQFHQYVVVPIMFVRC
jgi:hypothetical protein